MEQNQIWLKPKPTHIDEYFEDFLNYLKSSEDANDTLYSESLRLLKERVSQLVLEKNEAAVYHQNNNIDELKFHVRLCGAWLLSIQDSTTDERKQVLLTMTNCLVQICTASRHIALAQNSFSQKNIPNLIRLGFSILTHDVPETLPVSWNDIIDFSLDKFLLKFLQINLQSYCECCYEEKGMLYINNGRLLLAATVMKQYEKQHNSNNIAETKFVPEYAFSTITEKGSHIKESQKDDIEVIEKFVAAFNNTQIAAKTTVVTKRLKNYHDGETVAVEVVCVMPDKIVLKTIDPAYNVVEGELVFEQTLKIFSKYPVWVWAKVLKVGEQFNAKINVTNEKFSIADKFISYIEDIAVVDDLYEAHNKRPDDRRRNLREFWTDKGFMVYVNLNEDEDIELGEGGNAVIAINEHGKKGKEDFRGCVYGEIYNYDVEKDNKQNRDVQCPIMLRGFIESQNEIHLSEPERTVPHIDRILLKEFCHTLNILQSRETNPLLRYKMLCVIRILCVMANMGDEEQYFCYIAKYLKTLYLFAKADENEGDIVKQIKYPEILKDEDSIQRGTDILQVLSCFAKDYNTTIDVLEPYIRLENGILNKTASLVQSYNRLQGLLDTKTLRGIKKQILNQLSVVVDGDSTLELSNELEGVYGYEDDMKEFKESFMEAPRTASEQRQYYNICRGICAMMNNRGGSIYLGVNDRGVPVGVKRDLDSLAKKENMAPSIDSYMLYINRKGGELFDEKFWKYVTLKPIEEHNVVCIRVEPYPYDIVYLKDGKTYLRKNNSSAPITDSSTIEDIRRRRLDNLRKSDNKIIVVLDAIQKGMKVRLMGYRSSNSGTIQNRVVEPFYIEDNEYVHCYELASGKVKMFRLSRTDKAVIMNESWEHQTAHKKLDVDPFHMSGDNKTKIRLKLKLQAKNAIEDSYPSISQYIKPINGDTWLLDTFAYKIEPIVAFYLSNAEFVDIIEATGLLDAVKGYVQKFLKMPV